MVDRETNRRTEAPGHHKHGIVGKKKSAEKRQPLFHRSGRWAQLRGVECEGQATTYINADAVEMCSEAAVA